MPTPSAAELVDPEFWRLPLPERMARFAVLREIAPFLPAKFENFLIGLEESFMTKGADVSGDPAHD